MVKLWVLSLHSGLLLLILKRGKPKEVVVMKAEDYTDCFKNKHKSMLSTIEQVFSILVKS